MSSGVKPPAEYAFWRTPDAAITVVYSLTLFHEIDFVVNEGYRRIPHGGVEVGGLLFGRSEASRIRIEAFRSIESEHAFGPSFVLSERDLDRIQIQLSTRAADPELAGLEPVGWLVALFFVLIFPGNISQFVTHTGAVGLNSDLSREIRLLFQPVLVVWALWCTGAWGTRRRCSEVT